MMKLFFPVLIILFSALSGVAEDRGAIFSKNSVRDLFNSDVELKQANEFVYFRKTKDPNQDEKTEKSEQNKPEQTNDIQEKREVLASPEAIKAKYGEPSEEFPVLAIENAPLPFRGMMESLAAGEEDLAFQYARQYVRYTKKVQDRSMRVVGIMGKALEREGAEDGEGWTGSPQFNEHEKLLEKDLAENSDKNTELIESLDDDTKAMLRKAADKEQVVVSGLNKKISEKSSNTTEIKNIPVDPQGKVDMYLFFRPQDMQVIQASREYEKMYEFASSDKRVNFAGFTIDNLDKAEIKQFRKKTKAKFPIIDGSLLATRLKITSSPTLVFMSASTGKTVIEEGARDEGYYKDLVLKMQGRIR